MQVEVLEKQEALDKKNLNYEERIEELEKKTLYKNKAVTDDYNDYTDEGSYMINAQNMQNSPNQYFTGSLLVLKTRCIFVSICDRRCKQCCICLC